MKITKLSATQNGKRVNVYIDGEYKFTVEPEIIVDYRLHKDLSISEELVQKLKQNDLQLRLYNKALEKLARRPHSKFEIKTYLKNKLYKQKVKLEQDKYIDYVVNRLDNNRYLNDHEFAKYVIECKKDKKSVMELKTYLYGKGVSHKIIENTLEEFNFDNSELIKSLVKKKKRQLGYKDYDERTLHQKIVQYLIRKGFKWEDIQKFI